MTFKELNIIEPILQALKQEGYTTPTPIQEKAIPAILSGNDILGCAQTGTGKTAAFALPIIQKLHQSRKEGRGKAVKALILTPTRELAIQIGESFTAYGTHTGLNHCVAYGGIAQKYQIELIKGGVDVLIATPGRLLDLIGQELLVLKSIEFFVLDEADRMLDMGFAHDVKRIASLLPKRKQTLLFSATMPKEILSLASSILKNPLKLEVSPASTTVDIINQSVYFVEKPNKINLLVSLLKVGDQDSILVFSRTKHGADKIARALSGSGIPAEAIHGNKSQIARQTTLTNFKMRKTRVLVATDIAARGIDIENLTHVINFDLPEVAEIYVHRIGRTGRAGCSGIAISFIDSEQAPLLNNIQRLIGKQIVVVKEHAYSEEAMAAKRPLIQNSGENSGEDFRRHKRAMKLNAEAAKKGAPKGKPQRSTYSRVNGEVKSRPSNAIYANDNRQYSTEFFDTEDSRLSRNRNTTRRRSSSYANSGESPCATNNASPTELLRRDTGKRSSFNPNFKNGTKFGSSRTGAKSKSSKFGR